MNPYDPYWTALTAVQERAEAYALERARKQLLATPGRQPRGQVVLGRALIFAGNRFRAVGCRLARCCGCPETAGAIPAA